MHDVINIHYIRVHFDWCSVVYHCIMWDCDYVMLCHHQESLVSVVPPVEGSEPALQPLGEEAPKATVLSAASWGDFDLPKKKKRLREVCVCVWGGGGWGVG